MNLRLNHVVIMLLILVVLSGQTFANVQHACHSHLQNSEMNLKMDHSSMEMAHTMTDHKQTSSAKMDCCDEDCSCFSGTCTSLSLVISEYNFVTAAISASKIASINGYTPDFKHNSLYRPPIVA